MELGINLIVLNICNILIWQFHWSSQVFPRICRDRELNHKEERNCRISCTNITWDQWLVGRAALYLGLLFQVCKKKEETSSRYILSRAHVCLPTRAHVCLLTRARVCLLSARAHALVFRNNTTMVWPHYDPYISTEECSDDCGYCSPDTEYPCVQNQSYPMLVDDVAGVGIREV